jgi:hypothetical protein
MADKKKAGSRLLAALGKTKTEQMAKVYPKVKGDIRGKGPYLRGTTGKKGADTFIARRAVMAGTKSFPKPTKAKGIVGDIRTGITSAAAGAAGYALGKYGPKKTESRTHADKAREGAKELIKKQKAKKEKHRRK